MIDSLRQVFFVAAIPLLALAGCASAPAPHAATSLTSYSGPIPSEPAPAAMNAVDSSRRTGEVTTASRSSARKVQKKTGRADEIVRFDANELR